jgi:hypothetical protein
MVMSTIIIDYESAKGSASSYGGERRYRLWVKEAKHYSERIEAAIQWSKRIKAVISMRNGKHVLQLAINTFNGETYCVQMELDWWAHIHYPIGPLANAFRQVSCAGLFEVKD